MASSSEPSAGKYAVELTRASVDFLAKLDKADSAAILKKLNSIRENPFRFVVRLFGSRLYRLRIQDYRAIVDIVIVARRILVVRIGKRENVYD
ncbi:MAG: type II toxin-antitoxin system RelE/ParE family toxin [archaeon]